ncbi:hypothetical protein GZH53_11375 [Flavihumibacter sp. R14]|nr:hypothetical protein [Flavihumibacter soli]
MKAFIILSAIGYMFTVNNVAAQQSQEKMLPVVTITATGTSVSEKVRNAFTSSFKDAQDTRWYQENENYLVKFIQDDQEHNALYRKNGSLIYHITYGSEKDLPQTVKGKIQAKYPGYSIARVFNINQDSRKIWVVNLENKDYLVIARVEDTEFNEVSRLKNTTAPGGSSSVAKQ